ncbi:hypothetical protein [Brevundimonas sp.]|uniref:hypothetical protein n=1 Tax=Brevundimonas sp. TaxID=1871086 RepID=UPI003A8CE909
MYFRWGLLGASAALVGGACQDAGNRERYVSRDETGKVIASVTLDQPLPDRDTTFVFDDSPSASGDSAPLTRPMTFLVAGAFRCHWSDLITICQTTEPTPTRVPIEGGGYVRRLSDDTILVSNTATGLSGDFSTFRGEKLVAFGVMDETGSVPWRYDAQ